MFNCFKKVLLNQEITEEDAKKVNDFILRRWLTGDNRLIGLATSLNSGNVKVKTVTLLRAIAKSLKGQVKFIKFPQKTKSDPEQENSDIRKLARFYQVSLTEAQEYYEWYRGRCPEELETIREICKDLQE